MQFLIDSVIKNAWSLAKKNFRFMFLIMLTILILQGLFYLIISLIRGTSNTENLSTTSNIIINVLSMIIGIFINIGWKNINLQIATNGESRYVDFWNKMPNLFFKFLLAFILYFLAIFALFIIPGVLFYIGSKIIVLMILAGIISFVAIIFMIIFIIRIQFFSYIMIEQGLCSYKSLKKSREITKGHLWELIGFSMAKFIILLFGTVLLFVGLLRAIPTCQIATADFYRKLNGTKKNSENKEVNNIKKPIIKKPLSKKPPTKKAK